MYNICNMLKHKGETLRSLVDKSSLNLSQIAKKIKFSRSTIYRDFEKPDLSLDRLVQYGKVLEIDMSKYFPEILGITSEPPAGYNSPKSYNELLDEAKYWKDKYIDILEKYNSLLNEQLNISESRNSDKSHAS